MALEMALCVTWVLPNHDLSFISALPHPHCCQHRSGTLALGLPDPAAAPGPAFHLLSFALLAKSPTSPHTFLEARQHRVEQAEPRTERHSERITFEIGLIASFHHLFGLVWVQPAGMPPPTHAVLLTGGYCIWFEYGKVAAEAGTVWSCLKYSTHLLTLHDHVSC